MAIIDSLKAYWKLDEASGTLVDSHGSFDGTNQGATFGATGKINDAMDFESTEDDEIEMGASNDFDFQGTTEFSVQAWINLESLPTGGGRMFVFAHDGTTQQYGCKVEHTDATDDVTIKNEINGAAVLDGVTALSTGTFFHCVWVFKNDDELLYVDGSEDNTRGSRTSINNGTDVVALIGARTHAVNDPFDGIIDEVAVWDKALSAAEVSSLYNGGSGLPYPLAEGKIFNQGQTI